MLHKLILIGLLSFSAAAAAESPPPPALMVSQDVKSLAALVSDCRLPLAADPVALRGIVDHHLRPKADVLYAGQLILGRHWQDANPEQRRRFAEALYGTLVNRYATGLLLLTERNVAVVPSGATPDSGEAVVELRVDAGLATPLPIFLQMRLGSSRWRVYDARWEGQSYVLSLRHEFSLAIRRDGLEAVIQRLEASAGAPAGPPEARDTMAGRCLRARAAR
jgi:phospholipid transport system substrate-binding protein